ncbi:hypothetical protein B0H13DRAFT_2379859 [Mycena leptocephala]|nr:hypothetical protein B0H13DRAFT_2379859 [Mycena leptocephala]
MFKCDVSRPSLPRPPPSIVSSPPVRSTIDNNPHLFKIVTPIKVDVFESLLHDHPNQPFVKSVCDGLRYGFWPWAEFPALYPVTWDEAIYPPKTEEDAAFLRKQRDKECLTERFSESFGPDLLPGMVSMPIHAVPKPDIFAKGENLNFCDDNDDIALHTASLSL